MKKLVSLLVVIGMLALSAAAFAEGTTLNVSGEGVVFLESDMAIITLGVRETNTDVLVAQTTVNEKIASVRKALLEAGMAESDFNTDNISIYANYDYSDTVEKIASYTAYNSLSIRTTDMENVGALIDAAFQAGANTLDQVQFTVQDDTQAREQALTGAIEDAMRKAEVMASAAGMAVDSIETITEGYNYSYDSGRNVMYAATDSEAAAGTMIQAALVSVSATVTMEFELK